MSAKTEFFEPDHLKEDELLYEFSLREMAPVITRHRIATLRERILCESRGDVQAPDKVSNRDVLDEVKLCARKLSEVEEIILTVAETEVVAPLIELSARLLHLKTRLRRIACQDTRVIKYIENLKLKVDKYIELVADTRAGKVVLSDRLKESSFIAVDSTNDFNVTVAKSIGVEGAGALPTVQDTSRGAISKVGGSLRHFLPLPTDKPRAVSNEGGIRRQPQSSPRDDGGEDLSNLLHSMDLGNSRTSINSRENEIGALFREVGTKNAKQSPVRGNTHKTTAPPKESRVTKAIDPILKSNLGTNYNPNLGQSRPRTYCDYETPLNRKDAGNTPHHNFNRRNQGSRPIQNTVQDQYPRYDQDQRRGQEPRQFERPIISNNRHRNPIPNWNLHFSGDNKGLDLNQFLTQVSLMARADQVTQQELVASAIHLFSGPARTWYIAYEGLFDTWEDVVYYLRDSFVSEDADFIILKEIEQRRQGVNEPFILYLANLLTLFRHLQDPLTERKKVALVMRNMSPYLADRIALVDVQDTHHLASLCKKIEDVRKRSQSFRTTSEERSPQRRNLNVYELAEVGRSSGIPPKSVRFSEYDSCWNCLDLGHGFQDCKLPKMRIFCYQCGELGQLSNSCSTCGSENQLRRLGQRGRDDGRN